MLKPVIGVLLLWSSVYGGYFRESALAHYFLDGLKGIEIGAGAHNPFGLDTLNVDVSDDLNSVYKLQEDQLCGKKASVDILASGDDLPLPDSSVDFVITSHVIEHFYDPIGAIEEWWRVVRPGGYIFMIVPHKERTFDKDRPRTTLQELIARHQHPDVSMADLDAHHSVWITQDVVELCHYFRWPIVAIQDVDDKVGNGFTIVIQKH